MNVFETADLYLEKADLLIESIEELPAYDNIFLEGRKNKDDKAAQKEAENESVKTESIGLLQKTAKAIRAVFGKIVEGLKHIFDFFKYGGKAKDDKERKSFEEFQKMCKENPEFRNKKVNIHDYREINKAYEKVLSDAEKDYKKMKSENEKNRPSFVNDVCEKLKITGETYKQKILSLKKKVKEKGKVAASAVTVQVALDYARTSKDAAKNVQAMLDDDFGLVQALDDQLGKKQIKNAKRELKMLQSKLTFVRLLAGWRYEHALTLKESIKETFVAISRVPDDLDKGIRGLPSAVNDSRSVRQLKKRLQGKKLDEKTLKNTIKNTVTNKTLLREMVLGKVNGAIDVGILTHMGSAGLPIVGAHALAEFNRQANLSPITGGIKDGAIKAVADAAGDRSRWKHTEKVKRKKGEKLITDYSKEFDDQKKTAKTRLEKKELTQKARQARVNAVNDHLNGVYVKERSNMKDASAKREIKRSKKLLKQLGIRDMDKIQEKIDRKMYKIEKKKAKKAAKEAAKEA